MWLLRNWVLWVIALCSWAIASRCFKGIYRLHLQGSESVTWLRFLKTKAVRFSETSWRNHPATRRNNPEDLVLQYGNRFVTNNVFQLGVFSSGLCMKGAARLGYAQGVSSVPSSLYFSPVTQLRRKYGCIIHALLSSRDAAEKKAHCRFSNPLSVFHSPRARMLQATSCGKEYSASLAF